MRKPSIVIRWLRILGFFLLFCAIYVVTLPFVYKFLVRLYANVFSDREDCFTRDAAVLISLPRYGPGIYWTSEDPTKEIKSLPREKYHDIWLKAESNIASQFPARFNGRLLNTNHDSSFCAECMKMAPLFLHTSWSDYVDIYLAIEVWFAEPLRSMKMNIKRHPLSREVIIAAIRAVKNLPDEDYLPLQKSNSSWRDYMARTILKYLRARFDAKIDDIDDAEEWVKSNVK